MLLKVSIRRAKAGDIDWIVAELKLFAAHYQTKHPLFPDLEHAKQTIQAMIDNHVVFVAVRGEELLGFIGGILTPHFMNPAISTLAELFWWVAKEHRGSRAGVLLLNAFVLFGEDNAEWITVSIEHRSPIHEKCLLKRGFNVQERSYLKEVG